MKKTKLFLTILITLVLVPGIVLGQQNMNMGENGNKSVDPTDPVDSELELEVEIEEIESEADNNGRGFQGSEPGEQKGIHEPGTGLQEPELLDLEEEVTEDQPVTNEEDNNGQGKMNGQDMKALEEGVKVGPSERALERRSKVANAVQEMLKVAEKNEGIGQQIRQVAQEQNQIHEEASEALVKAELRKGFTKFLIGPDNAQLERVEQKLGEQREKVEELKSIKNQIEDEEDVNSLEEQITKMNEVVEEVEEEIKEERKGFSLFGWVSKIFGRRK